MGTKISFMRFRLSYGKDAVFRLIIYLARIETSFRSKFFAKDITCKQTRTLGPECSIKSKWGS